MFKRLLAAATAAAFSVGLFIGATTPIGALTDTWNNVSTVFCSMCMTISGTSFAAGSRLLKLTYNSSEVLGVDQDGAFNIKSPSSGLFNLKLDQGSGPASVLQLTNSQAAFATTSFSFGAPNNVSINKVNLTGAAVGAPIGGAATCGTSPALSTNAADFMGQITTGAGATACSVPFSTTKSAAPACMVFNVTDGTMAAGVVPTTTNIVFTAAASKKYMWICNDKA